MARMTASGRLKQQERDVLLVISRAGPAGLVSVSESLIIHETGLHPAVVRRTCRRLARKGKVTGVKLEEEQPWRRGGTRVSRWWEWRLKTRNEKLKRIYDSLSDEDRRLIQGAGQ
jgi:hypothetical protein